MYVSAVQCEYTVSIVCQFWGVIPLSASYVFTSYSTSHTPDTHLSSPRGKGDYHRLGHGDDSHQRTPKRVTGPLGQEKVVDISCGSLHCVVCSESGKVFAWGDNDEGQIGNDTTTAVQAPQV